MRFIYSLIRYVPDPVRGEFVNVGAIAGSEESSEWEVRQVENAVRARQMDERGSLPAVWEFIDRISRDVDVHETAVHEPTRDHPSIELSEAWLGDLSQNLRNIVQVTRPVPLIAESVSEALDQVFAELVVDPARRAGSQNKHPALAAVRKAYTAAGLRKEEDMFERVVLRTGTHRERLDFAVTNGRALQLTQTWSFQVADQETLAEYVKAWGWTMKAVQKEGGAVEAGDRTFDVRSDVDIAVVFIPPRVDRPTWAYEDAQSVFQAVGAQELTSDQADQLGKRATELLRASGNSNLGHEAG
jgi:hypothetical protein